jgi:hypothetical protein|tara:strand:+ start:568 stop:759 length:192 start_codon:yes stop_codon:yes gene_type:complete
MENGIYENSSAKFFVKNKKVLAKIMGRYYKTTSNFMGGAKKVAELTPGMFANFEPAFDKAKKW